MQFPENGGPTPLHARYRASSLTSLASFGSPETGCCNNEPTVRMFRAAQYRQVEWSRIPIPGLTSPSGKPERLAPIILPRTRSGPAPDKVFGVRPAPGLTSRAKSEDPNSVAGYPNNECIRSRVPKSRPSTAAALRGRQSTGPNHPARSRDGYRENNPHTATVPLRTA